MDEVSGKVVGLYKVAAQKYGFPADHLLKGLPLDPEKLPERIDWELFCTLNERLQAMAGGAAELEALGSAIIIVDTMNVTPRAGFIPDMNMWWPQTMKPRPAMPATE